MKTDSRWSNLYTVFAGGDDLLLVGPWDVALDFAAEMRNAFAARFAMDKLTISAGLAIVKPKFPIRLAAQQADELLETAKTVPAMNAAAARDQIACLGSCWKWSQHARIMDAGKQLADWIDAGDIQRGWLRAILDLAHLQRSEKPAGRNVPAMAGSRLAYHSRKWPRAGPARNWIDTLARHFDRFPNTNDPVTLHLPAIVRVAMLATGSNYGEDNE